jgi:pimeloyl-ACP methyl ester carboxylesterase
LGALTAVAAVLRDPSRFEGLVVVDGLPFTDGVVDPAERAAMMADFPRYVRTFVAACVPEPDSDHLRRWGEQILLRAEPAAAAQMRESHIAAALRPDYARVTVPTLVGARRARPHRAGAGGALRGRGDPGLRLECYRAPATCRA